MRDLGLNLVIRSRQTASYTPVGEDGLLVEREVGPATADSFGRLTGSGAEFAAWREFYGQLRAVAEVVAPTLLDPLPDREELQTAVADAAGRSVWADVFEQPLGATIEQRFANDVVRGVVLTDALIGTHTCAHDPSLLQNRTFLYHVIGNGTGEWAVPVGGMGAVAAAFEQAARDAGAEVRVRAEVTGLDAVTGEVHWHDADGVERGASGRFILANVAPKSLSRLRGSEPASVEGSQLKINMVLRRLPRLRSGIDPRAAFGGTFHIAEGYEQLETAFRAVDGGALADPQPGEVYCHTVTDPSILAPDLVAAGWHTLSMFGLHVPARLFADDHDARKNEAMRRPSPHSTTASPSRSPIAWPSTPTARPASRRTRRSNSNGSLGCPAATSSTVIFNGRGRTQR